MYLNEIGAAVISTEDGKAKYDAKVKELLANRQILSWILKRFVPEYADSRITDIEHDYIEPGTIQVSKLGVSGAGERIEGVSAEDKSLSEGAVYYDIMFHARCPVKANSKVKSRKLSGNPGQEAADKEEKKQVGLYINIEAQNSYYPGYPLEMRGVYYAARRLTAQLREVRPDTNYGALQKVYSIWLCMGNVPDREANTVSIYAIDKYDTIGYIEQEPEIYDLLSVIMLRINDRKEPEDRTLAMLRTLFSNRIEKKQKLDELRKLGIRVDRELAKGVDTMCNLSELIERQGIEKGIEQGAERAKKKITRRLLCEGMSYEQIADVLEASVAQIKAWEREL